MGYYDKLKDSQIQNPNEEVAVVDRKYIFPNSVVVTLEHARNFLAKFNLKVKGTDGVKYFKGKSKSNKKVIYSLEEKPIVNIADSKSCKKVFYGKTEDNLIAKVKPKDNRKFKIKFKNLANGNEAFFEMRCDKKFRICGVFYGKEKEGAPLVGRFTRDKPAKGQCTVEMAPYVDNMFLIALAHFFNDKNEYKKYIKLAAIGAAGVGAAALASHHHHHSSSAGHAVGGLAGTKVSHSHHYHTHYSSDADYDSSGISSDSDNDSDSDSSSNDSISDFFDSDSSDHSDISDISNDNDSNNDSDNDYDNDDDDDDDDFDFKSFWKKN